MLSVVSRLATVSLPVAHKDSFLRRFGIHQRCTDLCIYVVISVSLGILFASWPCGRHFSHICRQASHLLNFKHNIFWWPVYYLRLRCESVIRLAPSVQFVSLFFPFVRPLLVFWVECCFVEVVLFATVLFVVFFGFQEFWPNSDLNSSFGSVPRRPNLSTQVPVPGRCRPVEGYVSYAWPECPGFIMQFPLSPTPRPTPSP